MNRGTAFLMQQQRAVSVAAQGDARKALQNDSMRSLLGNTWERFLGKKTSVACPWERNLRENAARLVKEEGERQHAFQRFCGRP